MFTLYKITNTINQKTYIGWTSNVKNRWSQHKFPSNKCIALRNAIQKYGHQNFLFEILVTRPTETYAKLLEIATIKRFNTKTPYNMTDGGDGRSGFVCTEETKLKSSIAHTGKHHSEESKQKMREACSGENARFFGRHHSDETKIKMSIMRKGKVAQNKGQPGTMTGKHHSEETRKKMKDAWMPRRARNLKMRGYHEQDQGNHC